MTRSPARVLLVEDEAPARILLARGLERRGYRVTTVTDGSEALPMLHDGWDILVTDLCMPRLDGIGLLRMVRDSGVRAKCIVITSLRTRSAPSRHSTWAPTICWRILSGPASLPMSWTACWPAGQGGAATR
ncbi:MAG: response regulator [Chloroflexi bacterium]|nr:response regulator [Chloroflexota bacterium]